MDLLLFNGIVRTITSGVASAVAMEGGRILAVGESKALLAATGTHTRRVDLGGRTVTPGFNDAHAHLWKMGHLLTSMLDLRSTRSLVELADQLRARDAKLSTEAWLLGRGLNEAQLGERRLPTRYDLDRAVPHRPVVLTRTCGHIYAANSLALAQAGITADTPAPSGGVIERGSDGQPMGLLHETAMGLIVQALPPPTSAEYRAMILAAIRHQLSLGITSTSDCGVTPAQLDVYRKMDREALLPSRVNVMPLRKLDGVPAPPPLPERFVSERLRVDTVKLLADGGLSGATAALTVPYRHQPSQGVLRFEQKELQHLCDEAQARGWRIATHAIGDAAIEQVLQVYEALASIPKPLRHRIEHLGLPSAAHLRRASALAVIAVPQAIFLRVLGPNFRAFVPESLAGQVYPLRSMLDAGLTVALSSDAPVVADDNPLTGMEAAIQRTDVEGCAILPGEAITAAEALYSYTMGGAISSGDEAHQGSITRGSRADLAVLSGDPLAVEAMDLQMLRVDLTVLDGEIVYER